jgi:hypothetical protein
MNTKALSNCYDVLTPNERLPLIHAALARGDEVEVDRLVRSAPRVTYSLSNHVGLADAFDTVRLLHLIDLLATSANYLQAYRIADTDDVDLAHQMLECSLMLGHQFKVKLAGWRLFCSEHGFDADNCWKRLPGYDTVCRTELLAKHAAFSAEEANAFLQRHGRERPVSTAEDIAADLGEALKVRLDFWE